MLLHIKDSKPTQQRPRPRMWQEYTLCSVQRCWPQNQRAPSNAFATEHKKRGVTIISGEHLNGTLRALRVRIARWHTHQTARPPKIHFKTHSFSTACTATTVLMRKGCIVVVHGLERVLVPAPYAEFAVCILCAQRQRRHESALLAAPTDWRFDRHANGAASLSNTTYSRSAQHFHRYMQMRASHFHCRAPFALHALRGFSHKISHSNNHNYLSRYKSFGLRTTNQPEQSIRATAPHLDAVLHYKETRSKEFCTRTNAVINICITNGASAHSI